MSFDIKFIRFDHKHVAMARQASPSYDVSISSITNILISINSEESSF